MKEHTDVPQDPFADGITNPIRETPVDVGIAPAFPPNQEASPSTVVSAEPTVESGGPTRRGSHYTRQSFGLLKVSGARSKRTEARKWRPDTVAVEESVCNEPES